MNEINNLKQKQRNKFFKLRKEIEKNNEFKLNVKVINNLFNHINFQKIKIVSSFFSINSEIPTIGLNEYIISKKKILTFPIIKRGKKVLFFKEFKKNQQLTTGLYNIPEPPAENNELIPEVLFVPCLAFDNEGYRLGYGGGYYDRTFSIYKKLNHKFISIGYAYNDQKTSKVCKDEFDYKLHYVLTEKELYSFV